MQQALEPVGFLHDVDEVRARLPQLDRIVGFDLTRKLGEQSVFKKILGHHRDERRLDFLEHAVSVGGRRKALGPAHDFAQALLDGVQRVLHRDADILAAESLAVANKTLFEPINFLGLLREEEARRFQKVAIVIVAICFGVDRVHFVRRSGQKKYL